MILVPTKAEAVASSPLDLSSTKDEKPTLSFSALLHGVKDSKDEKGPQNGAFILSLGSDQKELKTLAVGKDVKPSAEKETLSSLLKNDDKATVKIEDLKALELNPKLTQNLTIAELKTLISDAKRFLKDKILDSVEYKKAQVEELPKTLKGLAQMAKKFGIDVSKITFEEVKQTPDSKNDAKQAPSLKAEMKEVVSTKIQAKEISAPKVEAKIVTDQVSSKKQALEASPKVVDENTKEEKEVKNPKAVTQAEADDVIDVKVKTPKTKDLKTQVQAEVSQEVKTKEDTKEIVKENVRVDDKKIQLIKEIKSTPLFKAQEKVEHTTEQLVQTKQFKVEEKTPKVRADETLKLLLRGEKPSTDSLTLGLTKDFSVATARVIAPNAVTETSKSIESLLRGADVAEEVIKQDAFVAKDVDSFDVKVKEAKQMMRYLSQDVKTAIEDYKSPFTRVKVQLNPAKMGEVDLTVVQRGKNLHVNLSSNNVAINTLAMNANELKTQLINNGIQNATLNFSNGSQSGEQNSHQQQNRQNERQANEEYNYFNNEEQNEEVISSLEIVVPNYA